MLGKKLSLRAQSSVIRARHIIAAVAVTGLAVALLQRTQVQSDAAELTANQAFIVSAVPAALRIVYLDSDYYGGEKSYSASMGSVLPSGTALLVKRGGLQATLNDGSAWSVGAITAQSVTVDYGCEGLRFASLCTELASNINAAGVQMIGATGATLGCS